jgi:hypothetical protein
MSSGQGKPPSHGKAVGAKANGASGAAPRTSTGAIPVAKASASSQALPRVTSESTPRVSHQNLPKVAGASHQALPRVTSESTPRVSHQNLPKVAGASQQALPRVTSESTPRVSHQNLPKVAGASQQALPRVTSESVPRVSHSQLPAVGPVPTTTPSIKQTNPFQKALRASAFDENEKEKIEVMLGRSRKLDLDADEEEPSSSSHQFFDGETPASKVTTRSTWRALTAPVKSKPKKRNPRILWTVIDQFAVAKNKRYDAPDGSRAHVFAWDVSLAMECPIPHHRQGRELSLAQTVDWFRYEAAAVGWLKVDAEGAVAAADAGQLVYVIPKNPKLKQIAIVRPGGAGDDGLPRVASAGLPRGNDLGVAEALGRDPLYFTHP